MKKTLFFTAAAAVALLLAPSAARADKAFSFKIGPPNTTGGASGFWNVTATRLGAGDADTSTSWKVEVVADSVQPPVAGGSGGENFARSIGIIWGCCPEAGAQKVLTASASVSAGTSQAAGPWSSSIAGAGVDHQHLAEADPPGGGGLEFNGSNTFTANHSLAKVASVMRVVVTDGPGQIDANGQPTTNTWTGGTFFDVQCTPEPASMTLALAGLGPAGLALLKRRRRSSVEETEETEEA
jgi:hypothetical protein